MPIVSNYSPTGHAGSFTTTSGIYTISGDLTTDADNDVVTLKGTVTVTSSSDKVGSFNLYFVSDTDSVQSAVITAIETARSAIYNELHPQSNS